MLIREMTDEDLGKVSEIENEIFSVPWSRESFEKAISVKNDIYLVAEQAGEICGYCGLWGVAGEGQITNVAVHPNFRRRGIGQRLLEEIIARGKRAGLNAFTLEVRVSNTGAYTLYEKLGFKNVGVRKDFYTKPVEDAIIMWCQFPL